MGPDTVVLLGQLAPSHALTVAALVAESVSLGSSEGLHSLVLTSYCVVPASSVSSVCIKAVLLVALA